MQMLFNESHLSKLILCKITAYDVETSSLAYTWYCKNLAHCVSLHLTQIARSSQNFHLDTIQPLLIIKDMVQVGIHMCE